MLSESKLSFGYQQELCNRMLRFFRAAPDPPTGVASRCVPEILEAPRAWLRFNSLLDRSSAHRRNRSNHSSGSKEVSCACEPNFQFGTCDNEIESGCHHRSRLSSWNAGRKSFQCDLQDRDHRVGNG
jgi:hypothetical protein